MTSDNAEEPKNQNEDEKSAKSDIHSNLPDFVVV